MTGHKGFDSAPNVSGVIDQIPDDIDFVCRYLSPSAWKNLTAAEARDISGGDMKIVTVWETDGKPQSQGQGLDHASDAVKMAMAIGQPEHSAIYFAVDYDADDDEIGEMITSYFRGVREEFRGRFKVGVYGSGAVCKTLLALNLVDYCWLACAGGWAGTHGFNAWHIKQHLPSDPYGFGFDIDPDETSGEDYGQWSLP